MTPSDEIACDLLRRLVAGERELVPLHLAMLLEKSARLDRGDDSEGVEAHYRWILPSCLAGLRLSPETNDEIVAILCAEVSRNPDAALISTIAFIHSGLAVKTTAQIMTDPPRELTLSEYAIALSTLTPFLGLHLKEDPEFMSKDDLERLIQVVKNLQTAEASKTNEDKSAKHGIDHHAPHLLKSLAQLGIGAG
jgi:hypothetical protein